MWVQRGVFRWRRVLIIRCLLLIRLLADKIIFVELLRYSYDTLFLLLACLFNTQIRRWILILYLLSMCMYVAMDMMPIPLQDKVHRLWPTSCEHYESAPGSSRWRSRCSELEGTSCCRCTEGSLYKASSPAHPLTTLLPTSTFVSGHHYSVWTTAYGPLHMSWTCQYDFVFTC